MLFQYLKKWLFGNKPQLMIYHEDDEDNEEDNPLVSILLHHTCRFRSIQENITGHIKKVMLCNAWLPKYGPHKSTPAGIVLSLRIRCSEKSYQYSVKRD